MSNSPALYSDAFGAFGTSAQPTVAGRLCAYYDFSAT